MTAAEAEGVEETETMARVSVRREANVEAGKAARQKTRCQVVGLARRRASRRYRGTWRNIG
jgi:hypothetical protein